MIAVLDEASLQVLRSKILSNFPSAFRRTVYFLPRSTDLLSKYSSTPGVCQVQEDPLLPADPRTVRALQILETVSRCILLTIWFFHIFVLSTYPSQLSKITTTITPGEQLHNTGMLRKVGASSSTSMNLSNQCRKWQCPDA